MNRILSLTFFLILSFTCYSLYGVTKSKDSPEKQSQALEEILTRIKHLTHRLDNINIKKLASKSKTKTASGSVAKTKLESIAHECKEIFKFVVDKIDKIVSKKFMIAAFVMISPLVVVYSTFFDPNFINKIIEKISAIITRRAGDASASATKGFLRGMAEMVLNNKLTSVLVVGGYVTFSTITVIAGKAASEFGVKLGVYVASKIIPVAARVALGV